MSEREHGTLSCACIMHCQRMAYDLRETIEHPSEFKYRKHSHRAVRPNQRAHRHTRASKRLCTLSLSHASSRVFPSPVSWVYCNPHCYVVFRLSWSENRIASFYRSLLVSIFSLIPLPCLCLYSDPLSRVPSAGPTLIRTVILLFCSHLLAIVSCRESDATLCFFPFNF
ncbi:hypothetical protein KP509_35G013700 [Ceratopteris richardii]|uniref:Uncharacterized protein n=1 Tax=Ceratopteris richardii TaxID=49495 RepID=A0A8T2QEQ8_CERRI|nr:hypothetical protein KP509_35G013700 [Ceratopteris richardii]